MSLRDDDLDRYRQQVGLSHEDLFVCYFALGGMGTALQVEAFCYGALIPSDHDRDVVAQALNEAFLERGGNHSVPYADSRRPSEEET